MKPQDMTSNDRETLSALFDGELPADARQFAMRRLAHDVRWQADCGCWQMIGDAMRRQAPIAAPVDFADRVRREVDASARPRDAAPSPVAAPATRRPVRLWAGGALAASLALAAVIGVRAPRNAAPADPAVVASAPAAARPATAASEVAVATPPADAREPEATPAPAAASPTRVAVAERTPSRVAGPRASRRADASAASEVPQAAIAAALAADTTNPFHVPAADPLVARPWPRAALPGATGAFTARYGALEEARGESPSFYPFEPSPGDATGARNEAP